MGQAMSYALNAMQNAQSKKASKQQTLIDAQEEERKAIRALISQAETPDQVNALIPSARSAGMGENEITAYLNRLGTPTPEQEITNTVMSLAQEVLSRKKSIEQDNAVARGEVSEQLTPFDNLFTEEFVTRLAIKKSFGLDIGEHWATDSSWLQDYADMDPNIPAADKITTLGSKYEYIPAFAQHLRDVDLDTRKTIVGNEIKQLFNDPELIQITEQLAQENPNIDPDKTRLALILREKVNEGSPLPDEYETFYDRIINLDQTIQSEILQKDAAAINSQILAEARAKEAAAQETFPGELSRDRQEALALAADKQELEYYYNDLITPEDRAKYGIPGSVKTFTEMVNSGKRFASENDKQTYQSLDTVKRELEKLETILFGTDGVYKGVGVGMGARKAAQLDLQTGKFVGSERGRNLEYYQDNIPRYVRLIKNIFDKSERLTDQDERRITPFLPSLGGLIEAMDSEALARKKFDDAILGLSMAMGKIADYTTVGYEGAGGEAAPATPEATAEEYEVGKVYSDEEGTKWKYLGGDAPWQKVP